MRNTGLVVLAAIAVPALALIAGLEVEEKTSVRKSWTIPDPAAQAEVKVDNIDGSISVVGTSGHEVEISVDQTTRAESAEKLQRAKQEVRLQMEQKGNSIEAYLDAPWRCRNGISNRGWQFYGYRVSCDFRVKIPSEARLYLRNVNGGGITVRDTAGYFDVENINGGIEMVEAAGSGRAYALNGALKVLFSRNPGGESYFGSLNGDVDLYFRPRLSADFQLKNFNGSIYTDFPVAYLPASSPMREQREGKFVYRSNDFFGVRVGNGGPAIKVEGFNGVIRIHEREN